jgi:hypothetical protein
MKKMKMLGLAAIGYAMLALPAPASAGVWHAEPSVVAESFTVGSSGHGEVILMTPNATVACKTGGNGPIVGSGATNIGGTTGTVSLKFQNCGGGGNYLCTTPGQPSGTVALNPNLVVHNILLEANQPGTILTGAGANTEIAHYNCGFGLITVSVTGALIGELEQSCGHKSKTFSVDFNSGGGVQQWTQLTTTGSKMDITFTRNSNIETAAFSMTTTITTSSENEVKCT